MHEAAVVYPFTGTGAIGPSNQAFTWIHGFILAETGGTSAVYVTLKDSGASSGALVMTLASVAGGSVMMPGPRIRINGRPYLTVSGSGTTAGTIFIS